MCKEFGIPANSDFRFTDGPNNGHGYTWTTGSGDRNTVYNGRDFFIDPADEYQKMGIHKWRRPAHMHARIYLMKNTDAIAQWDRFVI